MLAPIDFANVIACHQCVVREGSGLLRDDFENVPQPGFVGSNYLRKRVALAGQNPGVCPPRFAVRDAEYTRSLRDLRDDPSAQTIKTLDSVLSRFVPEWPVHGNYFPLEECGLTLDEIAYFNVVRCRTHRNSVPGRHAVNNCMHHFKRWVEILQPNVVVFIGKWAFDNASHIPNELGIPCDFMNRDRSLNCGQRLANRKRVVEMVAKATQSS